MILSCVHLAPPLQIKQGLRRLAPLRLLRMVSTVGYKMARLPGRKAEVRCCCARLLRQLCRS